MLMFPPPKKKRINATRHKRWQKSTRNPAHRCATLQGGRDAALAPSDAGIRRLDRKNESAAVDEALPPRKAAPRCKQGCGTMTA